MRAPILVSFLLVAACGGNTLDPGAGDSQGSGSKTLTVDGSINANNEQIANSGDASTFMTHFDIQLALAGGSPVTTGTVTVTSNGGAVALTYDNNQGNGAHWTGDQVGYFEVYQLDVTSGTDTISGVRVDGPDLHTFSAPTIGTTVDSTMPLALSWSRNDHADLAVLSTHMLDHLQIDDTGNYSLAAGSLRSSKDSTQQETISLSRTNQVQPAGAVAGSTVAVTVRNHVDVVVMINPNAP